MVEAQSRTLRAFQKYPLPGNHRVCQDLTCTSQIWLEIFAISGKKRFLTFLVGRPTCHFARRSYAHALRRGTDAAEPLLLFFAIRFSDNHRVVIDHQPLGIDLVIRDLFQELIRVDHSARTEEQLRIRSPPCARRQVIVFFRLGLRINLVAGIRSAHALIASTYRRLQRFFQHVSLADDWAVALVTALLGHTGPWYLCLDRTNWKVGRRDINILMLSVATKRYRVPLMWSVLDKAGNSNTAERIALMERYLSHFDASTVRMLLADREFIGQEWLNFLVRHGIAFTIRVKENQIVETGDGRRVELRALLRTFRGSRSFQARFAARCGHPALELHFAAKRLDTGELLITAGAQAGTRALNIYRKRWTIECLFADTKTRGLNLEDTRLTSKRKLHLLLAIVAIAVAWICRTASLVMGRNAHDRLLRARRMGMGTTQNRGSASASMNCEDD